jgi:hypothetical protein
MSEVSRADPGGRRVEENVSETVSDASGALGDLLKGVSRKVKKTAQ